jgi:hypothetical protein
MAVARHAADGGLGGIAAPSLAADCGRDATLLVGEDDRRSRCYGHAGAPDAGAVDLDTRFALGLVALRGQGVAVA